MQNVIDKANKIAREYGANLDRIAEGLGLNVMFDKLEGRLKEYYVHGSIVINDDLPRSEKKELIAHAVGHHVLHAGNHLAMQRRVYSFGNYHEKQANVFAACLLIPINNLMKLIADKARIDEIAEYFDVREELVRLRLLVWANFEKDITSQSANAS